MKELQRPCRASWTTGEQQVEPSSLKAGWDDTDRCRRGKQTLLSIIFQSLFSSSLRPFAHTRNFSSAPFPRRWILSLTIPGQSSDPPERHHFPSANRAALVTFDSRPHTLFYSSPCWRCVALELQLEKQCQLRESSLLRFTEEAEGKAQG